MCLVCTSCVHSEEYGLYMGRVESHSVLRYVCTLIGGTSKRLCLVCINVAVYTTTCSSVGHSDSDKFQYVLVVLSSTIVTLCSAWPRTVLNKQF